jgi:hypothetical protein
MTTNDIDRQLKLIEASRRIATIYTHYGQVQAAQKELTSLCEVLQANNGYRRACE